MKNELMVKDELVLALDKAAESGLMAQQETSHFKRVFMLAGAIQELRDLLTHEVMRPIMALQNTSLGFKTDRKDGYPEDVVRDCVIAAALSGVHVVGNEMNIITGQSYITKNGFGHKLKDIQEKGYPPRGIKTFGWIENPSVPTTNKEGSGALVHYGLEWTINGKKFEKTLPLAIKVNTGMGPDAIIGKASRKARAWLYSAITGMEFGEGDADDCTIVDGEVVPEKSPFEKQPEQPANSQDELPM